MAMFMRPFLKMIHIEIKVMCLREPLAAMVVFIMPLFFFLIIMEGIVPMPVYVNHVLPSIVALAVVTNACFSLPMSITSYREIKYFTQLKATPMTSLTLLAAMGAANFVMTVLGIFALIVVSMLFYGAEFGGDILVFSAGFVVFILSMSSIGILIASVCRTTRDVRGVSELVLFVMLFFSDLFIPLELQPEWVSDYVASFLPTSYAVELIRGLWIGEPVCDFAGNIAILIGVMILALMLSLWALLQM